jgi:hypothetical protein
MVFCESGLMIFDRYGTSSDDDDDDDDDECLTFGDFFSFLDWFGLVWFGGSLCLQSMDLRCPGN